ncbi:hypothetical protein EYZ11_012968 [Aspergillus tanneri]|uniref:RNase H type-1 domain-containing protein n=1 Tax=Aspergillus tanneri TaxID=1220188 RepID=A0A4S3IYV2_9EURO|nr:hypothetical protein EYZ11_012968 [Aspergillus tanneri]
MEARRLRLQDSAPEFTIRWIPTHVGVPGNEAADEAAKEAAADVGKQFRRGIIWLAAEANPAMRPHIQTRWKKQWETEKQAKPIPTAADQGFEQVYGEALRRLTKVSE